MTGEQTDLFEAPPSFQNVQKSLRLCLCSVKIVSRTFLGSLKLGWLNSWQKKHSVTEKCDIHILLKLLLFDFFSLGRYSWLG